MTRTAQEVKALFRKNQVSIREWSYANDFSPLLTYRVLSRQDLPKRGQSLEIAIALGIAPKNNEKLKKLEAELRLQPPENGETNMK